MNYDIDYLIRLLSYKEFYEVVKEFTFPYAIMKGEALSILAYGTEGMRNSKDIDILIAREHLDEAKKTLYAKGFKEITINRFDRAFFLNSSHQAPTYVKKTKICYVFIDVNFDIFWGEYKGKRINIADFLNNTVKVGIYGCLVHTLSPIKSLIALALHHYKDMNSLYLLATKKVIRFDMFKDIYYLIKNNRDVITSEQLYYYCDKFNVIQYMYYILFYTSVLFPDGLLDVYVQRIKTEEGVFLLDKYGLCSEEQKVWKCSFKDRLNSDNLFELIKNDLSKKDKLKIAYNKQIFGGS